MAFGPLQVSQSVAMIWEHKHFFLYYVFGLQSFYLSAFLDINILMVLNLSHHIALICKTNLAIYITL